MFSEWVQDVRFAWRQMRRAPGFAAGVVLVLALGLGASAAMLSVMHATLLRPLPYRDEARLLTLQAVLAKEPEGADVNLLDLREWQSRSRTLSGIGFYRLGTGYVGTNGEDHLVSTPAVSSRLFAVLGVAPQLGRTFRSDDSQPGNTAVLLSDVLWRQQFHADRSVVGKVVLLNGQPHVVSGVMPAGFSFPAGQEMPQMWVPAELPAANQNRNYDGLTFAVLARRKPEVSEAAVAQELSNVERSLRSLYTGDTGNFLAPQRVVVSSYRASLDRKARPALLAFAGAVGVLWLIACSSAGSLMLARGLRRGHELAIRSALGATQSRMVRQCVAEGLVFAGLAALCGLLLSSAALALAQRVLLRQMGATVSPAPKAEVLLLLLALTMLSTLLFAAIPALLAGRSYAAEPLRAERTRGGSGRAELRLQRGLVMTQLALTMVLLVSCGLLLRSVLALHHIPLGFRVDHVLVIEPRLPAYRYQGQDLNKHVFQPLLARVRRLPGVQSVSISTVLPLSGSFDSQLSLYLTRDGNKQPTEIVAKLRAASPELQEVLGFGMAHGRFFNVGDTATSQPVAVVNRSFARMFDPVNGDVSHFGFSLGKGRRVSIVGVMSDFHQAGVAADAAPEVDFCTPQLGPNDNFYQSTLGAHVELALRTARDPMAMRAEVERAMREVDPLLISSEVRTMQQIVDDSIGSQLLAARLLESFAALALLIAVAGLYSLLSYTVTARTRELGVRLALGAQRSDVLMLVLRSSVALLAVGASAGLAASFVTSRLLRSFLFGVQMHDGLSIAIATLSLLSAGLLAAWLPARRAAMIEPMEALRAE